MREIAEALFVRMRVLWILVSPKPDPTLRGFGQRVRSFPPRSARFKYDLRRWDSHDWAKDPEWFILQTGAWRWSPEGRRQLRGWNQARRTIGTALDEAFHEGDWTIVIDEVRALSAGDPPGLDLDELLKVIWQQGRKLDVSLMAATQAPRYVPGEMYDQPTHFYFGKVRDVRVLERLNEIGGGAIDADVVKRMLPRLGMYEFLYIYTATPERMEIVRAKRQ